MAFNKLNVVDWDDKDLMRITKLFKLEHGDCWTKTSLAPIRKKLRKTLLASQGYCCAYCRRKISLEVGMNEIDHILWKSSRDTMKFTYHRVNLVATCKRCNNNKKDFNVLNKTINNLDSYPMGSTDYNWIHPYIDDYDSHLNIIEGLFFSHWVNGCASPKGEKVIEVCKLDKLHTIEKRKMAERINSAVKPEAALLMLIGDYPEVKDELIAIRASKHFKRKGWVYDFDSIVGFIHAVRNMEISKIKLS